MKFISGKKLSMTQIWSGDKVVAVTPVLAGPCTITQVKDKAKDGYTAVQLSYGERKLKNINKPQQGHFKKAGIAAAAYVREFLTPEAANFKIGDTVSAATFQVGDVVAVTGTSKGRGFQGVVKRHHFHGFRATHGNKDQERMPGSIGPKGPAHVFKGTRMGGRMGGDKVTVANLKIAAVDAEKNILFIAGAIPGAINSFVMIKGAGDLLVNLKAEKSAVEAPEGIVETAEKAEVAEAVEAVAADKPTAADEPVAEVPAEVPSEAKN
ncbi:MAG: 50S ribosomal protein L3 [Patescibacteria group bacterium]